MMSDDYRFARASNSRLRIIVVVMNLLAIFGFGLIGVIIAYLLRAESFGTFWETHFTYYIRTFWIGFFGLAVAVLLTFIFVGYLIGFVVGIWWLIRSVIGLVKALSDQPIDDARGRLL